MDNVRGRIGGDHALRFILSVDYEDKFHWNYSYFNTFVFCFFLFILSLVYFLFFLITQQVNNWSSLSWTQDLPLKKKETYATRPKRNYIVSIYVYYS